MKKYIILFVALTLFIGCDDSSLEDQKVTFDIVDGVYVALNPAGVVTTYADVSEDEGEEVEINVELPNNVNSYDNTTVTYSLSGTATFGVDYTIDGATSEGGSIVIQNIEGTEAPDNLADNEDIVVTLLTDSVEDIDETIIITLTGVSSPDGAVALGRPNNNGGLLSATIIIGDVAP